MSERSLQQVEPEWTELLEAHDALAESVDFLDDCVPSG